MDESKIEQALVSNIRWFQRSGVMLPDDGTWGVAERIALTGGNTAIDKIRQSFPAVTEHDGWCVVEQRRADCNFQAAMMMLLSGAVLSNEEYTRLGENLMYYLYSRSGLLERKSSGRLIRGAWQWSHIVHTPRVYFDDDAWCLFLQLEIAALRPDLDAKYQLSYWAEILAEELWIASDRVQRERKTVEGHWYDDIWSGYFDLPHWGGLACMALARACWKNPDQAKVAKYTAAIKGYMDFISPKTDDLICSEKAYLLLTCVACWRYLKDETARQLALRLGNALVAQMDENGNLPAQHYEAPEGRDLVDLIYTMNWTLLGLQCLANEEQSFVPAYKKVLELVLRIQDTSDAPQFNGCWRGMFDLNGKSWGGGDRYEGGAGSIYTGWTNAPISLALAYELAHKDLFYILC